jgi:hypothetical protein
MAFADPLKEAVAKLFDIPRSVAFSSDKSQVIEPWGLTLRDILQRFGTEAMRNNFGPDFWVRRWASEFSRLERETKAEGVVITDLRFENEADAVRARGGLVVHLRRPEAGLGGAEGAHASELPLAVGLDDCLVYNSGSVRDLDAKVPDILWALRG